jgi:hypothetical protein
MQKLANCDLLSSVLHSFYEVNLHISLFQDNVVQLPRSSSLMKTFEAEWSLFDKSLSLLSRDGPSENEVTQLLLQTILSTVENGIKTYPYIQY